MVEKIVNCVDARLMADCMRRGIDPTSPKAPPSIRHAVARFFEGREPQGDIGGQLREWPADRLLEESQRITIAVTGPTARLGNPSITIADCGEGQTPLRMPETFLSLVDKSNKLRIPFVQGKFNMGGTGVLKFCGEQSIQLILTRRDPELTRMREKDQSAASWGFTIVRRERPHAGAGQVRNSVFRYLAPVGAARAKAQGNVLAFSASALPVMPERNKPYQRDMVSGSVVKLYEYDMKGFKSHALMKGGLLSRLELLLPEIGLPVRVHECRKYRGDEARSFANSLVGLTVRLAENRADNLESGYPTSVPFTVRSESMVARIYAFKEDRADSYRSNEGIIFTINGQTHGAIPKTFFERSRVKMGRLARSLLIVVDCSQLSVGAREDLFMNSRDRLSNGELRKAIEDELEEIIAKHPGLRQIREQRRSEEVAERLKDSRPLEEVLDSILQSSPTLSRLFLHGSRLSRPHRAGMGGTPGTGTDGTGGNGVTFVGKKHPTFFHFAGQKPGVELTRSSEMGRRARIKFSTDAENEYFSRADLRGHYHIEVLEGALEGKHLDHSLTLHNGAATWSVSLPDEALAVGDSLTLGCTVTDDTLIEPFVNIAKLRVTAPSDRASGKGGRRSVTNAENNTGGRGGQQEPGGLKMPDIVKVKNGDANWTKHKFDDLTACKVVEDAEGPEDQERSVYTFYINVDNRFLRTDMKEGASDAPLMQAKFVYGNVLVGLALIHDHQNHNGREQAAADNGDAPTVGLSVERTTRAMAPFLVPMIDSLGSLSDDDLPSLGQAGDDE